jgi:hypothetical protein
LTRRSRALLLGTLAVGVLDIADALVFYGLEGASPGLIFRGIASGLLGKRAAFAGGLAIEALGLALHFFISFVVVLACVLVAARVRALIRRPLLGGAAYGLVVYAVMYGVVLPLSGHGPSVFTPASVADELLAHVLLVGIPAALAARAALAGDR